MRIGQGIDVHAFDPTADRPLRLGGVHIDGATPLAGHSDADVVLHAVTDALLGAAGAGDLGSLVGVDQPGTAGADSATFVTLAVNRVAEMGWAVGNIDVTVVAQRPRLSGHREAMRASVAALLDVAVDAVSVKATTTDRLGFIGRGEGIACMAIVLLHARWGAAASPP
ncbi:MAG TPA: 2-C-methyl-D-erythritol 2,4-cyclodiphosphate synthase [Euzebya sp.]|nr:2-C-methyl-D-erythritol 2,4-cyclodiphosphate synthase [Euzebya sp.]